MESLLQAMCKTRSGGKLSQLQEQASVFDKANLLPCPSSVWFCKHMHSRSMRARFKDHNIAAHISPTVKCFLELLSLNQKSFSSPYKASVQDAWQHYLQSISCKNRPMSSQILPAIGELKLRLQEKPEGRHCPTVEPFNMWCPKCIMMSTSCFLQILA